jgi:chromosome partitioning protein
VSKVIALANQKGGVGKSTTTVNLSIGLASHGKKVLCCDADAQGNLTDSLGYQNPDNMPVSLATLLTKTMQEEPYQCNHSRPGSLFAGQRYDTAFTDYCPGKAANQSTVDH